MSEGSVLNQRWVASRGSESGVFSIWDERGNQLAIITDTQQPNAIGVAMAASPVLMEACAIVYDWLLNNNDATTTQIFREVTRALNLARPWDNAFQGGGPLWGYEDEIPE